MTASGRQAAQLRFNEEPLWLHVKPVENSALYEQLPFVGTYKREEPAVRTCIETRRKDVGQQRYATGNYTPTYLSSSSGAPQHTASPASPCHVNEEHVSSPAGAAHLNEEQPSSPQCSMSARSSHGRRNCQC